MKVVSRPGKRVVFCAPIPEGVGDHEYLCGRCGGCVLNQVQQRSSYRAVYKCDRCRALNMIDAPPGECSYRAEYHWWSTES
jgi:hypothetical protein